MILHIRLLVVSFVLWLYRTVANVIEYEHKDNNSIYWLSVYRKTVLARKTKRVWQLSKLSSYINLLHVATVTNLTAPSGSVCNWSTLAWRRLVLAKTNLDGLPPLPLYFLRLSRTATTTLMTIINRMTTAKIPTTIPMYVSLIRLRDESTSMTPSFVSIPTTTFKSDSPTRDYSSQIMTHFINMWRKPLWLQYVALNSCWSRIATYLYCANFWPIPIYVLFELFHGYR